MGTRKLTLCSPTGNACEAVNIRHNTTCPISTNDGSKRVIPRKGVPFEGVNDIPLNFKSQTPKTGMLGP